MRTLGKLGVDVSVVTNDPDSIPTRSRYCKQVFHHSLDLSDERDVIDFLIKARQTFTKKPMLIATSDEMSFFVAENYAELSEHFVSAQNSGKIVRELADKMTMFNLAIENDIPVPYTYLPANLAEAQQYAKKVSYPTMLKGVMGNRLLERSGKKMVVVNNEAELLKEFAELEDPEFPNVMIQELIPGGDDQVFIFNGYFDRNSDCLAGFTGWKIRQFPVHVGCASLGECSSVPEVAELTTRFMKSIGYQGILDIGYRLDPRDGKYKVLDVNPRVGQAFRMFTSEADMDVVRAAYMDCTDQELPSPIVSREGRRWLIEDYDIVSSYDYYREGSLTLKEWISSFKGVQELAWFSWRDPVPFLIMFSRLCGRQVSKLFRKSS